MSKVYIIQDPGSGRDFSSAVDYGSLVFLLDSSDRPSYILPPTVQKLNQFLKDFQAEDFIVWAGGDPLSPILVGHVLSSLGHSEFRYLRWERVRKNGYRTGQGFYVPVTVALAS